MNVELTKKENKVYKGFITFVIASLVVLMLVLVNASWNELVAYKYKFGKIDIIFIILVMLLIIGVKSLQKYKIKTKYIFLSIFITGFLLRLAYAFSINSVPISDFAMMYETAGDVLRGDFSNLWGTGYIARFPHITVPVMYFAGIRAIFPEPLLAIKFFNVVASTFNILIIYLIAKEVFNNKIAQWGALITALFPPLILYTAIYTTENLAIPFFLLGIYLFILVVVGKKDWKFLLLASIMISIGNLFRMVGPIILVAFILYIIVSYQNSLKKKIISIMLVIIGFVVPLVSTSFTLHYSGVMEYQLWKGREPSITSILKGFNVEYAGRWNPDDAAIPEAYNFDYDKIEEVCKEKIFERITTTPKDQLFKFLLNKYTSQWSVGDFSGSYWAEHSIEDSDMLIKFSDNGIWFAQGFYVVLITLTYVGLANFNLTRKNKSISLFYYIFCGYGIFYLVSENQARYAFTVCWIFIILALVGIDLIGNINKKEGCNSEEI